MICKKKLIKVPQKIGRVKKIYWKNWTSYFYNFTQLVKAKTWWNRFMRLQIIIAPRPMIVTCFKTKQKISPNCSDGHFCVLESEVCLLPSIGFPSQQQIGFRSMSCSESTMWVLCCSDSSIRLEWTRKRDEEPITTTIPTASTKDIKWIASYQLPQPQIREAFLLFIISL